MVQPEEANSAAANGGDGNYSYSKNSIYQRLAANVVQSKIENAIMEKLDVRKLSAANNNTIRIADMGCATGPNTFLAMQSLVNIMGQNYIKSSCTGTSTTPSASLKPQFHVFFNDHVLNDFNTLFTSLPKDRTYFASATPGSFHGRLFPDSSLHLVYSSVALHWLSRVPDEIRDPSISKASWNKGKVHYTSASDAVVRAYAAQFATDAAKFLEARAEEVVSGGMVVIIMPGIPDGMPHRQLPAGLMYDLMAATFFDMVQEGLVTETQVDNFNLPLYAPSPEEMTELVNKNGCFDIETIELTNPAPWVKGPIDVPEWIKHVRAAMEGMLLPHFDPSVIDQLFSRLVEKLSQSAEELESCYRDKIQLFVILKRK